MIRVDKSHHTIQQRDALLAAHASARTAGAPLFGVLAFTDAHSPWKIPPRSILPAGFDPSNELDDRGRVEAEIVGLDFVASEIVAALPAETWIVLLGDNGTPEAVAPDPVLGEARGGLAHAPAVGGPALTRRAVGVSAAVRTPPR